MTNECFEEKINEIVKNLLCSGILAGAHAGLLYREKTEECVVSDVKYREFYE